MTTRLRAYPGYVYQSRIEGVPLITRGGVDLPDEIAQAVLDEPGVRRLVYIALDTDPIVTPPPGERFATYAELLEEVAKIETGGGDVDPEAVSLAYSAVQPATLAQYAEQVDNALDLKADRSALGGYVTTATHLAGLSGRATTGSVTTLTGRVTAAEAMSAAIVADLVAERDRAVAADQANATAAQQALNAAQAEAVTRAAADVALTGAISDEVAARVAAIATVNAALAGKVGIEQVRAEVATLLGPNVPETLNTLREIADAILDADLDLANLTTVVGTKASQTALQAEVDARVAAIQAEQTTRVEALAAMAAAYQAADQQVLTALGGEVTARVAAIEAHRTDTTDVHGLADTAALATSASVSTGLAAERAQLTAHENQTTNVHGILNTAALQTIAGSVVRVGTVSAPAGVGTARPAASMAIWIANAQPANALLDTDVVIRVDQAV